MLTFFIAGLLFICALSTSITWERTPHPVRRPAFSSHLFTTVDCCLTIPRMNKAVSWQRIVISALIACVLTASLAVLQPSFKAGSIPDLLCELLFLPGKLVAGIFHDRGTASPEFVWKVRIVTAVFLTG